VLADELEADNSATKFSTGADRSVSAAYVSGLNRLAGLAAGRLTPGRESQALAPTCATDEESAVACASDFIRSFGERAWRRPVAEAELAELLVVYRAGKPTVAAGSDESTRHRAGLEHVVRALLQAPSFVFRTELGAEGTNVAPGSALWLTSHEAASALSYGLLASPPDDELRAWAASGHPPTADALLEQGRRLLQAHPERFARQAETYVREWLGIDLSSPAWKKDPTRYPEATPELRNALDHETTLLLQGWASSASLTELLTAPLGYVSRDNAWLYGVPQDSPLFEDGAPAFSPIVVDARRRAGVLTLPSLLGSWARPAESSPVQRGIGVMRKLLCREPPPVPPLVPPLPITAGQAPLTTRARFEQHTSDPACAACHEAFDPMGYTFEHYDAVGAYRDSENGVPVNSRGALVDSNGAAKEVDDAVALAALLAVSEDVHACVVRQVYRFTSGRRETVAEACALAKETEHFQKGGLNVADLMLQEVAKHASLARTTTEQEP
jgi:Protein of unknown function (DUF1588)/Protein of unknown function (DUF1592)/Protein of unknown function (DUF1595)/Protein of unknown function (DUF1585)